MSPNYLIHAAIEIGERHGFGNLLAGVQTAFAVRLRDDYGVPEESAVASMKARGPYPLPPRAADSEECPWNRRA